MIESKNENLNGYQLMTPRESFAFGRYTLTTSPLNLSEGQRRVFIGRRPLEVLALLLLNEGRVVSKAEIMSRVWRGAHVDPGSLTQAIFLIRRTLGKLPDGTELVETVSRHGYRIAPAALHKNRRMEHSETEHALSFPVVEKAGHDQFRLLVESIDEYAIYMLDCTGRVMSWNTGAERHMGYRSKEALGQHYSMFFVPEDVEAGIPDRELKRAARQGRHQGEGWRLRKGGERFWAGFVLTTMRSATGTITGFAKVVRDLSARKKFEDALLTADAVLRRERDRLHAVAESSMDALYICEAVRGLNGEVEDFVFTYLNTNVEKMLSLSRDVLLGGRMCDLLPFNRSSGLFDAYKNVVTTGEPFAAEFPIQESFVSSDWIRVQAVRFADGVVITASDITALRRAEEHAARLSKLLVEQELAPAVVAGTAVLPGEGALGQASAGN